MSTYAAILAIDSNLALGCKNKILFSNKIDLSYFKALASSSYCVSGRVTYESLPPSVKKNLNCEVLSSTGVYKKLSDLPKNNYLIIGGASIYNYYYKDITEWHITTHKDKSPVADTWLDQEVLEYIQANFNRTTLYEDSNISIDIYT